MAEVKNGNTVQVHYTGKLTDGTIFDTSDGRDPLQFTIGSNQVIPGFENGIIGMTEGDSKEITISPENAYGHHMQELVYEIEKSMVPPDLDLEVGQQLQMTTDDNQRVAVVVTNLTETTVTIDANHPLAGETLIFNVTLVNIN